MISLYQGIAGNTTSPSTRPTAVKAYAVLHKFTRHLRLHGKMFLRMLQLHAGRFVALPHANEYVLYYWAEVVKAVNGSPEMISGEPCVTMDMRWYELICLDRLIGRCVSSQTSGTRDDALSRQYERLVWKNIQ